MGVLFCELFTLLFCISKNQHNDYTPSNENPTKKNQTPTNQPQKSAPEEHKPSRRAASSESDLDPNGSFRELRFAGRSLGLPEDVLLLGQNLTCGCHWKYQRAQPCWAGRYKLREAAALRRRDALHRKRVLGLRGGFRAPGSRARSGSRFRSAGTVRVLGAAVPGGALGRGSRGKN